MLLNTREELSSHFTHSRRLKSSMLMCKYTYIDTLHKEEGGGIFIITVLLGISLPEHVKGHSH